MRDSFWDFVTLELFDWRRDDMMGLVFLAACLYVLFCFHPQIIFAVSGTLIL